MASSVRESQATLQFDRGHDASCRQCRHGRSPVPAIACTPLPGFPVRRPIHHDYRVQTCSPVLRFALPAVPASPPLQPRSPPGSVSRGKAWSSRSVDGFYISGKVERPPRVRPRRQRTRCHVFDIEESRPRIRRHVPVASRMRCG